MTAVGGASVGGGARGAGNAADRAAGAAPAAEARATGARAAGAASADPASWTSPADIAARVQRVWKTGRLLHDHAMGAPFTPIAVPLKGPQAQGLAEHLSAARAWAARIERAADGGRAFRVETTVVGGRSLGRTSLPGRAIIESYDQAWRVLAQAQTAGFEQRHTVEAFGEVLRLAAHVPEAHAWALAHPLRATQIAPEWPAILRARDWLDWHRGSGKYLREVDAAGVDTKLIERHRSLLAELLAVPASAAGFTTALGLAAKPSFVRLRFDPDLLGLPRELTEASLRLDELSRVRAQVTRALIVENEVSYLSAPVPAGGVVLWGKGYDAATPASLAWLEPAAERGDVLYWGDLDTHGFAILNRVRGRLPGVRSVLMDRETLLAHEARWGSETTPANVSLPHLTEAERELYEDLVTDRYAPALRLEQERIDWPWALARLAGAQI
ncbi:Wadjet anti-phage system protein JetD domain-containing protein [Leucobacter sp. HY1910]